MNQSVKGNLPNQVNFNKNRNSSRFSVFPTTKSLKKAVNPNKKKPVLGKSSKFSGKFTKKETIFQNNEEKPEIQRPINLLKNIVFIIKAANVFRFRIGSRPPRFINERQMTYINDQTVFPRKFQQVQGFLRRFTEKNIIKRAYFFLMSFLTRNLWIFNVIRKCLRSAFSSIPVIKPYQKTKVLWDILILVTIVFYFFLIPLQISFDFFYDEQLVVLLHSIHFSEILSEIMILIPEFLLIVDTMLKFSTGFYENGVVITNRSHIVSHYLKKGLFLDILSYCPIIAQSFLKKTSFGGNFLKFFQLLMFCKLKRVKLIMENFQEIISMKGKHDHVLQLLILAYKIVLFSHIIACLWHAIGYYNSDDDGWLDHLGLRNSSANARYWRTLYWAVSVMVAISNGQILPQTSLEYAVGVLIFLVSALFFGYSLNSMREIFELIERNQKNYKENLSAINGLMQRNNVDFELQGRVRKYLQYTSHQESNPEKESEVLGKLTNTLRKEVVLAANAKELFTQPFFSRNFSSKSLEELSYCLKKVRYSPEELVYEKGQSDDCSMFLISKGSLESLPEVRKQHAFGLKDSGIIGCYSFITDQPRENSIRSVNFSTLFEIKKTDFINIIRKNPEDLQRFYMIRDQMKLYGMDGENKPLNCECCFKETHNCLDCPFVHFVPDRDFLRKKAVFSQSQKRDGKFYRAFRRKVKSLLNLQQIQEKAHVWNESMSAIQSEFEIEEQEEEEEEEEKKKEEEAPRNSERGWAEIQDFASLVEEMRKTAKEKSEDTFSNFTNNNTMNNLNSIIAENNNEYEETHQKISDNSKNNFNQQENNNRNNQKDNNNNTNNNNNNESNTTNNNASNNNNTSNNNNNASNNNANNYNNNASNNNDNNARNNNNNTVATYNNINSSKMLHYKFPSSNFISHEAHEQNSPKNAHRPSRLFQKHYIKKQPTLDEKVCIYKKSEAKQSITVVHQPEPLIKPEKKSDRVGFSSFLEVKDLLMMDFEEAKLFVNYFPEGNMDKIIEKMKKKTQRKTSSARLRHYSNAKLKHYKKLTLGLNSITSIKKESPNEKPLFLMKPIPVKTEEEEEKENKRD